MRGVSVAVGCSPRRMPYNYRSSTIPLKLEGDRYQGEVRRVYFRSLWESLRGEELTIRPWTALRAVPSGDPDCHDQE